MKRRNRPTPRGATLVESLVALLIFAIGVLGALQASLIASHQNSLGARQTAVGTIGRDLVDTFERLPYGHPALSVGQHALDTEPAANARPLLGAASATVLNDGRIQADGGTARSRYEVTWDVRQTSVSARTIDIDVSFLTPSGGTKTVRFNTIKYDPESMVGAGASIEEI